MRHRCVRRVAQLFAIVVVTSLVGTGLYHRYYGSIPFDRTAWITAGNGRIDNARQRMCGDLQQHYLKPGMTRQEIRYLLGKPDCDSPSRDVDVYFVGAWGYASVNVTTLDVYYDEADRVTRTVVGHKNEVASGQ